MRNKKILQLTLLGIFIISTMFFSITHAQNWTPLPPYNTLWPLWSPILSPIDPVTGIPVPIVSDLFPTTVLPVQPGLTWDPELSYPWLLYNTPLGMAYYDPVDGVNLWPPIYLFDSSGPLPISLPLDYASLAPIDSSWLTTNVPIANDAFISYLKPVVLPPTTLPPLITPPTIIPPISPAPWTPPTLIGASTILGL
ncbi:MAG: hypothetical protein ACMUJM_23715 [bacterium]